MLYLFTDYDLITRPIEKQLLNKLPEKRKERALKFNLKNGRLSCIIGYLLFLYGYRTIYNGTDLPDFDIDENQKPYLSQSENIHFNISHCKSAACCVFSNQPIGIDIQHFYEVRFGMINRICSPEEKEEISNAQDQCAVFSKIWTIKEAISKQSGIGIFRDIRNISNTDLKIYTKLIDEDKYLTVASISEIDFTINKLSLSQLLEL